MLLRMPSMELNWLPNSFRKGLSVPRIAVIDDIHYSGEYWRRTESRYITPFDMDLREGPIIVLTSKSGPSSIAHEFRHHWQCESAGLSKLYSVWAPASDSDADYWKEIKRYFTEYPHERDALMFEARTAPDDVNKQWIESLR